MLCFLLLHVTEPPASIITYPYQSTFYHKRSFLVQHMNNKSTPNYLHVGIPTHRTKLSSGISILFYQHSNVECQDLLETFLEHLIQMSSHVLSTLVHTLHPLPRKYMTCFSQLQLQNQLLNIGLMRAYHLQLQENHHHYCGMWDQDFSGLELGGSGNAYLRSPVMNSTVSTTIMSIFSTGLLLTQQVLTRHLF